MAGTLVGLPEGSVLVPVHGEEHTGHVVLDPGGEVRPLPAHLPPGIPAVPLPGGRLVLPGRPERDDVGEWRPTVSIVDVGTGAVVRHHRVRAEVQSIVAGADGLVAVAVGPTWEYWTKYHGRPGFDLTEDCYVLFLDEDGPRGTWTAGRPIAGPLAIGANGDLLVPVAGELISLGWRTPRDRAQISGNRWAAEPLQSQIRNRVPLPVAPSGESRQRPDCGLRREPSACCVHV